MANFCTTMCLYRGPESVVVPTWCGHAPVTGVVNTPFTLAQAHEMLQAACRSKAKTCQDAAAEGPLAQQAMASAVAAAEVVEGSDSPGAEAVQEAAVAATAAPLPTMQPGLKTITVAGPAPDTVDKGTSS